MNLLTQRDYNLLFQKQIKLIDVRAPIEFAQGHIPDAINIPLLDNAERELVGTVYKLHGKDKAIALGEKIVSGDNKLIKFNKWLEFIRGSSATAIYCFRGGLRSQTVQKWLAEQEISVPILEGGYKAFRNFAISEINQVTPQMDIIPISGKTGSLKSALIETLESSNIPVIHLERLANHRGSAFGALGIQPSQGNFENQLAFELIKNQLQKKIYIEDESRMIGKCVIPEVLFAKIRSAAILWVEEPLEVRVGNILKDYIAIPLSQNIITEENLFQNFSKALQQIKNKLGGLRFDEINQDLQLACKSVMENKDLTPNRVWIEKLLKYYYDPLYEQSLIKRSPKVLLKGTYSEILNYIASQNLS